MDAFVPELVTASIVMNGQFCCTGSRVLVQRGIAGELRTRPLRLSRRSGSGPPTFAIFDDVEDHRLDAGGAERRAVAVAAYACKNMESAPDHFPCGGRPVITPVGPAAGAAVLTCAPSWDRGGHAGRGPQRCRGTAVEPRYRPISRRTGARVRSGGPPSPPETI
ncbi:hypothetical protein [Streptomyces antibioticus]|uniref:hypothetical protein n=1 Tax=Streptomyces antibioticus TaxID=1890 RepID=UPI0036B92B47